jgi:hypothetical protein
MKHDDVEDVMRSITKTKRHTRTSMKMMKTSMPIMRSHQYGGQHVLALVPHNVFSNRHGVNVHLLQIHNGAQAIRRAHFVHAENGVCGLSSWAAAPLVFF